MFLSGLRKTHDHFVSQPDDKEDHQEGYHDQDDDARMPPDLVWFRHFHAVKAISGG